MTHNLITCEPHNHSMWQILRKHNIWPTKIVHLGSHDGIEYTSYCWFGCDYVRWFECNPLVYEDLLIRIKDDPRHKSNLACLWSEDGLTKEFYFYRDKKDGASGLFKPDKMFDYIHDCPLLDEVSQVKTIKLDTLITNENLFDEISQVDLINIDVQGSELEVFKGAQLLLNSTSLKTILCEVSWDNVYKDAPLIGDIDKYLAQYRFRRIDVRVDWPIHGDGLYVRD